MAPTLLVLGCGFTGSAVARRALARGGRVFGTVRSEVGAAPLRAIGVDVRVFEALDAAAVAGLFRAAAGAGSSADEEPGAAPRVDVAAGVDVVVAFPPDGRTDAAIAPALGMARRIVYVSSTGVYGEARGRVDESTPVDRAGARSRARLDAEAIYREKGAIVLRAAGIYGPGRGLHRRILEGTFRMPGDAAKVVSRVHVDDLASFILCALERGEPGATFVVADATPVPQREAIDWLCRRLGRPLPPTAPLDQVAETLRHDRAVDSGAAQRALGVTLAFPGYREGFEACLEAEARGREHG